MAEPSSPAVEDKCMTPPPSSAYPEPNTQEALFFFNIIKNVSNLPDINWDSVAADSGFKNAAVAKKRFYQIKVKLGLDNVGSSPGKSPSKGGRKPKAAPVSADGDAASDTLKKATGSPKVAKRRNNVKKEKDGGPRTKLVDAKPALVKAEGEVEEKTALGEI